MSKWQENMRPTNKKWIEGGGPLGIQLYNFFHFPASSFQKIYEYSNIRLLLPRIEAHLFWIEFNEILEYNFFVKCLGYLYICSSITSLNFHIALSIDLGSGWAGICTNQGVLTVVCKAM